MRGMYPGDGPPLVIVEGSEDAYRHALAEILGRGWTVVDGWSEPIPVRSTRVVRSGRVEAVRDAELALLAALDGYGLVVAASADRAIIDRLIDDLRHVGTVDHRVDEPAAAAPVVPPDARALLGLLAEGHSLGEAATILGLSRRTADRRLSMARTALGVDRTTAAINQARQRGWLSDPATQPMDDHGPR